MHTILKVIGIFIGLFVIVNGIWVVMTPPFGDEPQGYLILAAGIFIPVITLYVAQLYEKREA
jgi:hypothetical protein